MPNLPPNLPPMHRPPRSRHATIGVTAGVGFALVAALLAAAPAALVLAAPTAAVGPVPASGDLGTELFALVERYAALGAHRTGSAVDAATLDWFEAELKRRGGRVERQVFEFQRFEGSAEVTIDGQPVPALPLYYESVGELVDDRPGVAAANVLDGAAPSNALLDAVARARAAGARSAVVATLNPLGELQAPNRIPALGSGLPVALVPGRWASMLQAGRVRVTWSGRIAAGRSANLVAAFGSGLAAPIVIGTPLTCWFQCAAERGTGVALALALAQRLAASHPVLVVATSGNELLPPIGLAAWLQSRRLTPGLVLHLGANVALGRNDGHGRWSLADTRWAHVRMDAATLERLRPRLAALGVDVQSNAPLPEGSEAARWAGASPSPLLALGGTGPQFHTPADTPYNTTNPALLQQTFDALAGALEDWVAP